jgi:OOP family OmpA-OmpF porin
MKRIVVWLTAVVLGTGLTVARADGEQGFYLGAGIGQFNVEVDNLDEAQDVVQDFDEDDTSWKIFAGWRFAPFFAVELDYVDFGGPSDNEASLDLAGFSPYLVGTLPLGIFELFAKVGYLFYDIDIDTDATDIEDISDSQEDFIWGVGFGVALLEQRLFLRLEYEQIEISELDTTNALWLSGGWRF